MPPMAETVTTRRGASNGAELRIELNRPESMNAWNEQFGLDLLAAVQERSEEHTSELQSQFHLVCRLLPEKKKAPSRLRCHRDGAQCEPQPGTLRHPQAADRRSLLARRPGPATTAMPTHHRSLHNEPIHPH